MTNGKLPDPEFIPSQDRRHNVCFDLDGVIALTEPLKAKAHISTVEYFGGKASLADYLALMGKSHESVRAGMIQNSAIQVEYPTYSRVFRQIYHDLVEMELEVRPGVVELVQALRFRGCHLAVVSSSTRAMVHQVLDKAGLLEVFEVVVSADDVEHKKPDPEPYLKAIHLLGATQQACVIFEDSASGIEAGIKAGGKVIAVRHSMNQHQEFKQAETVLESFEDTEKIIQWVSKLTDNP